MYVYIYIYIYIYEAPPEVVYVDTEGAEEPITSYYIVLHYLI